MLVHNFLEKLFSAPSNISVLRVLHERVLGITGRETARLTNLTHRSALKALTTLEELGIVTRVTGGRDHLFTLNRQKYITKEIIHIVFEAEKKFHPVITSAIKKSLSKLARSIILYGSVVRKEETIKSDYDLCIIYDKNLGEIEKRVSKLRDDLKELFSVQVAPLYITSAEFKQRAKKKLSPIEDIVKEGVVLCGSSIHELLK